MLRRIWIPVIVAMTISACGSGLPVVTPTVAPTNTLPPTAVVQELLPSLTPVIRPTDTSTPTPLPTNTLLPTETATMTTTGTQTPTHTPTPTATFTQTASPTPTDTATGTDVPSPTPLILDTASPSPAPSFTPTWTPPPSQTPTNTPSPTATFTDTPDAVATANAERLMTRAAVSSTPIRSTFTPVPQSSPTHTLIPPTLDVTPTVITATPFTGLLPTPLPEVILPTVEGTPVIDFTAPTATATPVVRITPSPFPIEQIPATVVVQEREQTTTILAPTFNNTTTLALTFDVGPGGFFFNGQPLSSGGGVRLFSVNPADPSSFARTDRNGFLTFAPIGGGETPVLTSPFYDGFTVSSADSNQNFVSHISWSPNGQRLAFIVQPAPGTDNINAGVWFWDAGSNNTGALLHDCPNDGYNSCNLTSRPVGNWQSQSVEWSPNSATVVITAFLPAEGRQAIFVSGMNFVTRRPEAPPMLRWDNAQWLNNFELLVSGRAPDGGSRISVINPQDGVENVIYNASANGLFIFDAVQRPNGQIIAIGREGGAFDGAYRMYRIDNGVATPISGYAGNSVPQSVSWSANYGEAVLTVNGQQFIINAGNGGISTANVSGEVQVGPGFSTNAGGETVVQSPPPTGVVAGSRYNAGQQIQHIGEIPRNMRIQPDASAAWSDIVQPGEFVTILAGPYDSGGYEWWQVSNANGTRAWVSVRTLDGFSFFNP